LGPAAQTEKPGAAPTRTAADPMSSGGDSKFAELRSEKTPEATAQPIEEFRTPPPMPSFKIAPGQEPLAFGSLLETPEAEDEPIFQSKSPVQLGGGDRWGESDDEVKEEVENSPRGGWRPSGLDEEPESAPTSNAAPDWREQAFHGNSPANSSGYDSWTPSPEPAHSTEAAEAPAVAVSTIETDPSKGPDPFTSDAWAQTRAAGVEEKLTEIGATAIPAVEETATPEAVQDVDEEVLTPETSSFEPVTGAEEATDNQTNKAEPANSWFSVSGTPWEVEAKKAALLASTWDMPVTSSPDETQEVLPPLAGEPAVATEAVSQASAEVRAAESERHHEHITEPAEAAAAKSWGSAWETPAPPVPSFEPPVEGIPEVAEPKVEEYRAEEPVEALTEPPAAAAAVAPESVQPDMDELVARVLDKMNPEVLQTVTREILKPVIEAIIRDELDSNKS